jgi:hypothetical protein
MHTLERTTAALLLASLAVTVHAQADRDTAATRPPLLLVLSKAEQTLALVDPATRAVVARVPSGPDPWIANAQEWDQIVVRVGNGAEGFDLSPETPNGLEGPARASVARTISVCFPLRSSAPSALKALPRAFNAEVAEDRRGKPTPASTIAE